MIWVYTSYKKKVQKQWGPGDFSMVTAPEEVFRCEAGDILSADQLLLAATGLVAAKEPLICAGVTYEST